MGWNRFCKIDGVDEATRTVQGVIIEEAVDKSGQELDEYDACCTFRAIRDSK